MITAKLWAERGRRRAVKLGLDPERLPPGQSPTVKWPVMSYGPAPAVDLERWSLSVHGEVEEPFALRWDELLALPQHDVTCDFHCVTRWSRFDARFRGVRVRSLLERAGLKPSAKHVLAHCFGAYSTNVDLDDLLRDDVLIAVEADGAPLDRDHGGPARLLVPHLYGWKSAKWVRELEVLDDEHLGFWERNGYHRRGDPWAEERHS